MKASAKRKCLCCCEFYPPDHRNVRHQRYCSKPPCCAERKAQSHRRWQQRPENENYFRGPENRERVKDWRKRNPGYWRKKTCSIQVPLQEVFQEQLKMRKLSLKRRRMRYKISMPNFIGNWVLPIVWTVLMGFLDINFLQKEREKPAVFPRYLLSEF
jgi:hypothetical protein